MKSQYQPIQTNTKCKLYTTENQSNTLFLVVPLKSQGKQKSMKLYLPLGEKPKTHCP